MGDPEWKTRLIPVLDKAVDLLSGGGTLLDSLCAQKMLSWNQYEELIEQKKSKKVDVARKIFCILRRIADSSFAKFCTVLGETDGGDDLLKLLRKSDVPPTWSPHQRQFDAEGVQSTESEESSMQTPAGTTSDPTSELKRRYSHECALVDDRLYLFGGSDGVKYVPRDKIFVMNVLKAEKKWIRWLARCQVIPPPCEGARCVVIDRMIYSYGGKINEFRRLGIVYRLDPKKMEWIEVATPIEGKKPHERSECCLCVIGSRMIMFGGMSGNTDTRRTLTLLLVSVVERTSLVTKSSLGQHRINITVVMIFTNLNLKREIEWVSELLISLLIWNRY